MREKLVEIARSTLDHAKAGTQSQADAVMAIPASNYYDEDRWRLEMERIFGRVPLVLGFSAELREPHSYRALEVAGVPIILSRGGDGTLRSFVGMCSHRGAVLFEDGSGVARRFTCPYHAWSYDQTGELVGITDRADFGELDTSCLGLEQLPVEERSGIIWGLIDGDREMHLDEWLAGYDEALSYLHLDETVFVGRQGVEGPAWKVAYDGYLDLYHLPILHKNTFGPDYCNKAVYADWGPHQRAMGPDERFTKLDEVDEAEWTDANLTGGVWTIFPHISIARFAVDGGMVFMISQLFPGDSPTESFTVQNFLANFEPDDVQAEGIRKQMDFLLHVVRDEDYFTGRRITKAISTGRGKESFLFGRNELGGQRFHKWTDALVETDDADLVDLYRTGISHT